jgi:hypothetical protein
MFTDDRNITFRIQVQEVIDNYLNKRMVEAVARSASDPALTRERFRAACTSVSQWSETDKQEFRAEIVRQDPGFVNFYEHAFYSYGKNVVPELSNPGARNIRIDPPHVGVALYTLLSIVCKNRSVLNGEYLNKMLYVDKSFFIESIIRDAMEDLLFAQKSIKNIHVSTFGGTYGHPVEPEPIAVQSFDFGTALENAARGASFGGTFAAAGMTARAFDPMPEPTPQPIRMMPEAVSEPVPEAVSEPVLEAVSEPAPEAVSEPVPEEVSEPVSEAVSEPVPVPETAVSEATIDIMSHFNQDRPWGDDMPAPEGSVGPDHPDLNRYVSIQLPPSNHSFTDELERRLADPGIASNPEVTPDDSVSQVLLENTE